MYSEPYHGYVIISEQGKWCVNLGIERGVECFDSLDDAKAAVDERLREIEQETKGRP
jgi:hypothetical protein